MYTKFFTFFIVVIGTWFHSSAQNVIIPDPAFKSVLVANPALNTNNDADIQFSEAAAFDDTIYCAGLGISDLTGLEAFVNLRGLACVNNQLTQIDVSQNTQLLFLICAMNQLTSLDVSHNTLLRNLRCPINHLTSLDLSHNPQLEYLYCSNNQLSVLNVSQNVHLRELYCESNNISELDVSGMTELEKLDCGSNSLTSLNLTNCPLLIELHFPGNSIHHPDVSHNPDLEILQGVSNGITTLDLTSNPVLRVLDCPFNQIGELDLSHCPILETVYLFSNALNVLNVANGHNEAIHRLWTNSNPNLTCIQVDSVAYSEANWTGNNFQFDAQTTFSTDCANGIEEIAMAEAVLFPNPAQEELHVRVADQGQLYLYTTTGKLVHTMGLVAGEQVLDFRNYSNGTYLIYIETSEGSSYSTVVTK